MRTWAIFFYGVAAGLLVAYVASQLYAVTAQLLLIGAAIFLAIALLTHQRYVSKSKGRRWRKTV